MDKLFAKRMDELVPSGIRKVNEKALAMERAGETVIHFELGRPDFDTPEYIKNACIEDIKKMAMYSIPPTLVPWSCGRRLPGN